MAQLTVRNLPEAVLRALKIRAAHHGRSAEAEHRLILEQALKTQSSDFWERVDRLRRETSGTQKHDSARLLRKMRDQR